MNDQSQILLEKVAVIDVVNQLFISTDNRDWAKVKACFTNDVLLDMTSIQNTRTFVGSYNFHLTKAGGSWRIDRFKFNLKFIDGNLNLEASQ